MQLDQQSLGDLTQVFEGAMDDMIDGIEIGPDVGSCGTAAWGGVRTIVSDIQTDPLWVNFRGLAAEAGLAEGPAFGRIRIDVIEVFEIRRVLGRFVVQGQGVLRRRLGDTGHTREEQAEEGTHRHH